MPTEKITKSRVDNLPPPATGQAFLRDTELKGFAVRITASGIKSFVVEKRIAGRTRRYTLAKYPELTVEQARKEAQTHLGRIAKGENPAQDRQQQRLGCITLQQAFEDYLQARRKLKPKTIYSYRWIFETYFADWHRRSIRDIGKQDIIHRHQKLGTERGETSANIAMKLISALFNFAIEQYDGPDGESLVARNPVDTLKRNRAWFPSSRRQSLLGPDELPCWKAEVETLKTNPDPKIAQIGIYLELLLFMGLRRTEAAHLQARDIDISRKRLTSRVTKNGKPLVLPIPSPLVDDLQSLVVQKEPDDYVFQWLTRDGFTSAVYRYKRDIKVRTNLEFTLHDLRRTFITTAESLDISMLAIKRLVNHTSGDVTAGYVITDVERLRGPMEKIAFKLTTYLEGSDGSRVHLLDVA